MTPEGIIRTLGRVADRLRRPTDTQLADRFIERGIRTIVSVPCSITATVDAYWDELNRAGLVRLIKTTHEHNLVGIASGIYFGSGEIPLLHMQNSGLPNATDGLISFARVYKVPILGMVTWRGSSKEDDSEPHQAIGAVTNALTRVIVGKEGGFGSRGGRGILREVDKAIDRVIQQGEISLLRLSPDAFTKTHPLVLPETETVFPAKLNDLYEEIKRARGSFMEGVFGLRPILRKEALDEIVAQHRQAAILFSNGFTSREAQATADRLGNFYNTGYMGGTLAIGWGMALSNPQIEVVVVDGEQNAQMSNMKDHLVIDYPDNLHWYILDNGVGASVGVSRSLPLAPWYYGLARVIRTVPDRPGEFKAPRVKATGSYFDSLGAQVMAERIGPLPTHAARFRNWVNQQSQPALTIDIPHSVDGLTHSG